MTQSDHTALNGEPGDERGLEREDCNHQWIQIGTFRPTFRDERYRIVECLSCGLWKRTADGIDEVIRDG